ncbi:hypothetical protein NOS3756_32210 [Nostoc sp. NIES-3756]|nr:hypothetical protein NOS3756_32210 [Nostoc sp. NIES-3756]
MAGFFAVISGERQTPLLNRSILEEAKTKHYLLIIACGTIV